MTNPTLERAARAADPGAWLAYDQDKSWGWARQRVDRSFDIARAVLMAVREPDDAMLKAGSCDYGWDNPSPSESWPAMIDAILNDGEGK